MSLVQYEEQTRALVRKAQSSYQPQKRPSVVLDEDDYIEGLSKVIKRQFFPALEASDAEEANSRLFEDADPLASTGRPQTARQNSILRDRSGTTPRIRPGDPRMPRLETPCDSPSFSSSESPAYGAESAKSKLNTDLSLDAFQAKYTSEDNASFLNLLDEQNLKNREKYAWHYNNNKIYSENTERQELRLQLEKAEQQKQVAWIDDRKAIEGWKVKPKNALMFDPEDLLEKDPARVCTTKISYKATRMPEILSSGSCTPSSDTVQRAIRGDSPSDFDEPTVNGYTFVDEPDTPLDPSTNPFPEAPRNEMETKPNPFKIPETPARDQILERLVTKNRRASTPTSRVKSGALTNIKTPKFKSSPVLSPAAQRMLGAGTSGLRDRLKTPGRSKLR